MGITFFIYQCILVHITIISVLQFEVHGQTRLAGGESSNLGRVEVYEGGKWGTVRGSSYWDMSDCMVTCRELGFGEPLGCFEDSEQFGTGIGKVSWSSVHCVGDEGLLTECDHNGCDGCSRRSDVGVHCDTVFPGGEQNGDVRLVDGREPYEGRLEVFYGGTWGTVCDDEWDLRDSDVVCRMLGYDRGAAPPDFNDHGAGSGKIMLTYVDCSGYEETLDDCPHSRWFTHYCGHHEDVGVRCVNAEIAYEGAIRLFNGTTPTDREGRVEIYHNQTWGSVCADFWGMADSVVACRQLGFSGALAAVTDGSYGDSGAGSDGMTLNRVSCRGTEGQILECRRSPWYFNNCSSAVEAAVVCDTTPVGTYHTGDARILPDSNVVEVYYAGAWGTICPLNWDIDDGDVICRGLNQSYGWKVSKWIDEENIASDVIVTDVWCNGNEDSIVECNTGQWHSTDCGLDSFASVFCTERDTSRIRLVGGSVPNEGRLEVFYGEWGSVCDDGFDLFDAQVVCRELGYRGAFAVRKDAYFGEGTGQVWFERLDCTGTERTVYNCRKSDWGVTECSHARDVGVICVPDYEEKGSEMEVRLRDGKQGEFDGRLEVFHEGKWGTICDDGWTDSSLYYNADAVCKQLGYRSAFKAFSRAEFGEGTGSVMLDEVTCSRSDIHLSYCDHDGWYEHDCTHDEDVGVQCLRADNYDCRLRKGPNPTSGRVEIYQGGTWHVIASMNFTITEANVVCRQRGFKDGATNVYSEASSDVDVHVPYLNGIFRCTGKEETLRACAMTEVDVTDVTEGFEPAFLMCHENDGLTGGQIAGIVIGCASAAFLTLGVIIFISTRGR